MKSFFHFQKKIYNVKNRLSLRGARHLIGWVNTEVRIKLETLKKQRFPPNKIFKRHFDCTVSAFTWFMHELRANH